MPKASDVDRSLEGNEGQANQTKQAGKPVKPSTPQGNPPAMQRFSQDQSFADPVHSGGSPRVATDAHQDMPPSTSRGSLNLSEEE